LNKSAQTDQNSAKKWNILVRGAIQNLSDLHQVEKEIAKIHMPTIKETETLKAFNKAAKATIAMLEKR
jgi:molybdate-binding protein